MRVKRIVAAVLLALALAVVGRTLNVEVSPCAGLTPDNWFLWWFYECGKDAAGGGGSGAA